MTRFRIAGIAVLVAFLSACGGSEPSPEVSDASPTPSPTPSPSATASPSPWSFVPGEVTMVRCEEEGGPCVPEIDLPMNADGTSGAGCTPPPDVTLPDGLWFGYLTAATPDSVTFDLACSYHFDSEQHLANLEGSELEGYTWTNDSTDLTTLGVSEGAGYYSDWTWVPWSEAPVRNDSGLLGGVWIAVNSGRVTEVVVPVYS